MIVNEKRGQRALLKLISEQTEQPITKMIREVMLADYNASNMERKTEAATTMNLKAKDDKNDG